MKDIGYYMSLPYDIKVRELSKDDGGGVFLSVPLLGDAAVNAHGETYIEARSKLESIKRDFLEMWLDAGVAIPEPCDEIQQTENWLDGAIRNCSWEKESLRSAHSLEKVPALA